MNNLEEPVIVPRGAVNQTPQDYPDLAAYHDAVGRDGVGIWKRYLETGAVEDLNEAIQVLQNEANKTPEDHPDFAIRLGRLADSLWQRFIRTNATDDLVETIQVLQNELNKIPQDHPDFAIRLGYLADSLWERYMRTNATEDLIEAIQGLQNEANKTPEDHPGFAILLGVLANLLWERYVRTGATDDLERSIRLGQDAINHTAEDKPCYALYLSRLGVRYKFRYHKLGIMTDLEEAIQLGQKAIDSSPKDYEHWWKILYEFGNSHYFKFLKTKEAAHLEKASQIAQRTLGKIPPEYDPSQASFLCHLGMDLFTRYLETNAMADLEQAIRVGQGAVDLTPEKDPNRAQLLYNHATHLMGRFSATNTMIDFEIGLRTLQDAIDTAAPNHPERTTWLHHLAVCLEYKVLRTLAIEDLERFTKVMQEALDGVLEDNPQCWAIWANYLGAFYITIYEKTGSIADIEKAIQLLRKANHEIPKDHPERILILLNLGACFYQRHLKTNDVADLDIAIQVEQEAVSITPKDHPARIVLFGSFAISLVERFFITNATVDLEEAIQVGREGLDGIPKDDNPSRTELLGTLGTFFQYRYVRTANMADLEQAIYIVQEAVEGTPKDGLNRSKWLNNLSVCFRTKYERTNAMADLEEAIRVGQMAVNESPENHPNRVEQLKNLGICFQRRYRHTRVLADLEKAIAVGKKAIDIIPENQPDRAALVHHLAVCFQSRYLTTKVTSDLREAVRYYRSALYQANAPSITRIRAGHAVLGLHVETSNWQHGYEDTSFALGLIQTLISRSLANSDKQYLLGHVARLACNATAAALQAGEAPLTAIRLLEQGRGALAASILDLRIDVLELQTRHPELAEEFVRLRNELKSPINQGDSLAEESLGLLSQQQASRRYNAGIELDRLVGEIHNHAEFEDFLLSPSDKKILVAAEHGPIVMVNVGEYRCDALLIEQHRARSLALPHLNRGKIEEMAQRYDLGSCRVLEWLWDVIADPILDALGFTQSPSGNDWPHVWWIPMGSLSRFPLHAAGYHCNGSNRTVLDRVISSYSPSIRAIIHGRQRRTLESTPSAQVQALLVAMQDTPKHQRLPSATSEIQLLRHFCKSMALHPVEPGSCKPDILSHLRDCKIFHFAGHGKTDSLDPSRSYLLLTDWETDPLTVASIMDLNIHEHAPFLAYLSACGTGQIRVEKYFDEGIHLISACQLAGFRHVIGTLWSVEDDVCQDMARFTYEEIANGMQNGHMTDESVCRGLHKATRLLRDRWLDLLVVTKRQSRFFERPDRRHQEGNRSARESDQRDDRSQRPAQEVVSDDEDYTTSPSSIPSNWVPYVHFGV